MKVIVDASLYYALLTKSNNQCLLLVGGFGLKSEAHRISRSILDEVVDTAVEAADLIGVVSDDSDEDVSISLVMFQNGEN